MMMKMERKMVTVTEPMDIQMVMALTVVVMVEE
jgi:hypothetical protein